MDWRPRFPKKKSELQYWWTYKDFSHTLSKILSKAQLRIWEQSPEQQKIIWSTPKSVIQKKWRKPISKKIFQQIDWELAKNGNFSRSESTQRKNFSQKTSYRQPKSDQPNHSAVRRSDNRPTISFTPYEHKFPDSNIQTSSNVVRFTTTDDTINELSDLCPLNY